MKGPLKRTSVVRGGEGDLTAALLRSPSSAHLSVMCVIVQGVGRFGLVYSIFFVRDLRDAKTQVDQSEISRMLQSLPSPHPNRLNPLTKNDLRPILGGPRAANISHLLSHSTMVLWPVRSTFDSSENGLILKYGLIRKEYSCCGPPLDFSLPPHFTIFCSYCTSVTELIRLP